MNPNALLDLHCGDVHRLAVMAAEEVGWVFVEIVWPTALGK